MPPEPEPCLRRGGCECDQCRRDYQRERKLFKSPAGMLTYTRALAPRATQLWRAAPRVPQPPDAAATAQAASQPDSHPEAAADRPLALSAGSGLAAVRTTRASQPERDSPRSRSRSSLPTWAKAGAFPAPKLFRRLSDAGLMGRGPSPRAPRPAKSPRAVKPASKYAEASARGSPEPSGPFATASTDRRAIAKDMLRYVVKNRLPSRSPFASRPTAIPKPPAAPRPPSNRRPHRVVGQPSAAHIKEQLVLTQKLLQAQQQAVAAQAEAALDAAREGAEAAAAFGAIAEAEVARLSRRVCELERASSAVH